MTRTMKIVAVAAAAVLVLGVGVALGAARPWDGSSSSARSWTSGGMMGGGTMGGSMMSGRTMGGSMMSGGGMMGGSMMSGGMMGGSMMSGGMMGGAWTGEDSAPAAIEGARRVTMTADDLRFSPSRLTLTAGEAVNIVVRNIDEGVHDFTIPALGVHVTVQPGQDATVGLRPSRAGTYRFLCTVPGHSEAGMRGTIVVES